MDRNKLLKIILFSAFFIYGLDYIGQELYWDYSTWWFDMIMHLFGGLWQGLLFIWFFSIKNIPFLRPPLDLNDPKLPHKTMFFVLLIGFLWEVFEFYVNNYIGVYPFDIIDTSSDIFFDLAGGGLALLYFFTHIMPNRGKKVQ